MNMEPQPGDEGTATSVPPLFDLNLFHCRQG
jgi:hypothetical protein